MKTYITLFTALFISLATYSQKREHFLKIYNNLENEFTLQIGGNDKDVLNIGGFIYSMQYENNLKDRQKFSFSGGMYFNTFLEPLKAVVTVNYGIVWNDEGAAGIKYGSITGLEYQLNNLTLFGGGKYDQHKNKIKPLIGVGYKF